MNPFEKLATLVSKFWTWLKATLGLLGPQIDSFQPVNGWPGSIVTITGDRFSEHRDANLVRIGGAPALVIEAEAAQLLVLAGKPTVTGTITVEVDGKTAASAGVFTVRPQPAVENPAESGPPRFFSGPMHGTPALGVTNQPILVVLAYPTDHTPGPPALSAASKNTITTNVNNAGRFWREASYNTTSWNFTVSDWLALPRPRRDYVWQEEDVEDARRNLFEQTHRAIRVDGNLVLVDRHGAGFSRISRPNPSTWSYEYGASLGTRTARAMRKVGNRVYAAAGAAGLYIVDLLPMPNSPVEHGPLAFPGGWLADLDVLGNHVIGATRENGLVVVDVINPAAPVLVTTMAAGAHDWTMAVRVSGNRALAGFGTNLRLIDLSNPGAPSVAATVDLGRWITSIDLSGNLAAIATDGGGVHFVEFGPGSLTQKGQFQNVIRVRSVALAGNHAYLAANDAGLVIVDISDPSAPVERSRKSTSKPAYAVTVAGSEAFVAIGLEQFSVYNVSNPAAPTHVFTQLPGIFVEPDLNALRNALTVADDSLDVAKDANLLYLDALGAWLTATGNPSGLDSFKGVIVYLNGPFLRGASGKTDRFAYGGRELILNDEKGRLYLATSATWGRVAHEIGHWFKMFDIYQEQFEDGTVISGTAEAWCMSGDCDQGPLFSGHQIHQLMHFYDAPNVVELVWDPASAHNQTYELIAHDHNQDPGVRIHVIKIVAASGLMYFVEVRQRPAGLVYDQSIGVPAGAPGVVLVTKATEGATFSNIYERPITLIDVLQPGGQFVDGGRNLIVRVEALVESAPAVYRVRVEWNQPIDNDPNGKFDMTITPWSEETWESVDVWIDSKKNGFDVYSSHEPTDTSKPVRNGDRPWVKRDNKVFARIRNTGPENCAEAYVSLLVTSPPGIGDNGNWVLVPPTQKVLNIPGKSDRLVEFTWKPAVDKHTCLKVVIMPQHGEIETKNNLAQENVAEFDSAGASSHQPVILEAEVRSPFSVWRKVDLVVKSLPQGWHAVVDHAWVWVEGKGSRPVRVVMWTDLNTLVGEGQKIPSEAFPRIEGWTDFDHRYLPIGGILAPVRAVKKVNLHFEAMSNQGFLWIVGSLSPTIPGVTIAIEVTNEKGAESHFHIVSDATGKFELKPTDQPGPWPKGKYFVQLFVAAGAAAAETTSEVRPVVIT